MIFTELSDAKVAAYALNLWANYIETGNPTLSAFDAEKAKEPVKALSLEQMQAIVRLRQLAHKMNNNNDWSPPITWQSCPYCDGRGVIDAYQIGDGGGGPCPHCNGHGCVKA